MTKQHSDVAMYYGRGHMHIGIPEEEGIHAVIAPGYPDETYPRIAGRKNVTQRYFEG